MSQAVSVRTARKRHTCPRCREYIQPGQRYRRHVAFPNDNDLGNSGFWVLFECSDCATEIGRPIPEPATTRED